VEFEHGGFNDQGWSGSSPPTTFARMDGAPIHRRICARSSAEFGWQDARTDLDLSVAYADNRMNGNGLQEKRLLEQDYSSIYTQPDITKNRSCS
jgi:hypothetical protein